MASLPIPLSKAPVKREMPAAAVACAAAATRPMPTLGPPPLIPVAALSAVAPIRRLTAADIAAELARIGHTLAPLDIVVINTSAGVKYGQPDYVDCGCGVGYEGTMYLTERGVRVVGTDGWSWDAPFSYTAKKYAQTHDASIIWEGHKAGRHIGYCQIEKLHNLEVLPPTGFMISCFPMKIERASAGWTRAVAILEA